jgi:glycosyltransferase involved in cell wall biosynthesis
MPPLRILAFEPFDAGSHRAVRESIARHSCHQWTWLTRPGRQWKWRMRLSAAEMLEEAGRRGLLETPFDLVCATSLMSASDLRALLLPRLRSAPLALIMHENQAAYPAGPALAGAGDRDVHFALTNLTSILAADLVVWNSRWNLDSFSDGIAAILANAGDSTLTDVRGRIEARSVVLWPPVEAPPDGVRAMRQPRPEVSGVRVVWPHRWEHDKGPDELLELATRHSEEHDLRWTILGERYREVPASLIEFERRFAHRIDHIGFIPDRAAYWRALASCDWVLSTARHEFFGIAVVEAMLAGCLPWLPDRLSYPEIVPAALHGASPLHPPAHAESARALIAAHLQPVTAPEAVSRLDVALARLPAPG